MDSSRALDREDAERFIETLTDYRSAIPDELARYYLAKSGFKCDDKRVERLVALAAQKFLADIANDALSHSRLRQQMIAPRGKAGKESMSRISLTNEDLEKALKEYGVTLKKPAYYVDTASTDQKKGRDDPTLKTDGHDNSTAQGTSNNGNNRKTGGS